MSNNPHTAPRDGDFCRVVGGTHAGKRGTATDVKTSKTGHLTLTVVPADGVRFKTLAKNVVVRAAGGGNVARTVERARASGTPVLWVQHADDELAHKHINSSFEQTTLEAELAALRATHITLAGAASNWCIRATACGALERGYDLTLVKDAHITGSMVQGDGARIEAASIIEEHRDDLTQMIDSGRRMLALGLLVLLQACMVLPRTTQVYDPECQVVTRHMVLEAVQVAAIHQCANQGCVALVVGAGIVSAASAVISGSIVVAGNIAYWFEKQAQCRKEPK